MRLVDQQGRADSRGQPLLDVPGDMLEQVWRHDAPSHDSA
jgi:hypothetical protein